MQVSAFYNEDPQARHVRMHQLAFELVHHKPLAEEVSQDDPSVGTDVVAGSAASSEGNDGMMGWFTMNRVGGGPASPSSVPFSYTVSYFTSDIAKCCFAFSIPIIAFFILLPSFRKKHFSSVFVVLLCLLTGLGVSCAYVSSSWLVGEATVEAPISPRSRPIKSLVGLWVGLWHLNVTYITPEVYINHLVTWGDRTGLTTVHKTALQDGWPLALVSLTAELSGEGIAWHGVLGEGICASSMASYPLMAAIYFWAVWVVMLFMCPELCCLPLTVTGILLSISSVTYVLIGLYFFPENIVVSGSLIRLKLGWAWWLMAFMSITLTIVSCVVIFYDYKFPGKLGAMFKLDFYTQIEELSGAPELLYAYETVGDHFSQMYDMPLTSLWQGKQTCNQPLLDKNMEKTREDSLSKSPCSEQATDKDQNPSVNYVNETELESSTGLEIKEPDRLNIDKKRIGMLKRKAISLTSLRKRSPPQENSSESVISEPVSSDTCGFATIRRGKTSPRQFAVLGSDQSLSESVSTKPTQFATIRKGKTMPRQFSVQMVVPQISPKWSGGSQKKSFSRIHSKFRPKYSPRKPSRVNLISIPKLEMDELSDIGD